jgi:hypothetical protein
MKSLGHCSTTNCSICTIAKLRARRRQGRSALPCALGRRVGDLCERSTESRVSESAILGRPEDLAARAKPQLPQIARELLQNMDSAFPDLYQAFFLGNSVRQDIPPAPPALRLLRGASNRPRAWAKSQPATAGEDERGVAAFNDPSDASEDGALESPRVPRWRSFAER